VSEYKEIEGQCGTCKYAAAFDYAPSPSGPEDGVHCTSEANARSIGNLDEFRDFGFLDLFRLECLAEENYRCPHWRKRNTERKGGN
jgi:hypothetical protein